MVFWIWKHFCVFCNNVSSGAFTFIWEARCLDGSWLTLCILFVNSFRQPAKFVAKENDGQHRRSDTTTTIESEFPSKTSLFATTPSQPRFPPPHTFVSSTPPSSHYVVPEVTLAAIRTTPMGASKLLRDRLLEHVERLDSTTTAAAAATTPRRRRRRLIDSGALRLDKTQQQQQQQQQPGTPKRFTPARRRIGYDGTPHTPSWELLSTTACSRSRQVHRPKTTTNTITTTTPRSLLKSAFSRDDDEHEQNDDSQGRGAPMDATNSFLSSSSSSSFQLDHQLTASPSNLQSNLPPLQHSVRKGCRNPVALTLWNDGKEDFDYLRQHDDSRRDDVATFHVNQSPMRGTAADLSRYHSPSPSGKGRLSLSPAEPTKSLFIHTVVTRPVAKRPFR